ncbi:MAG: 1-acylglycerol-3-phosphate O-acyltransferase [Lachnospiraceae bacterium]|nr:1-acylglycerol-3-phosphate O-acyltransferase [Lachnospiraceae bacterium]
MIRFIILLIVVFLFLTLSFPILIYEAILGKINPAKRDKSALGWAKWAFGVVTFLSGTKITVKGVENIPTDRSVLYIGNHQSYFDIIINYLYVPRPTGFISKNEVEKVPSLRVWMRYLRCLFMDRKDLKQSMGIILKAIDYIKEGISIFIFPEGTRSKNEDEILPFKAGSFKIATKSGCEVVPVSINNSAAVFENQFPKIKKAHVILEYGKPIPTKDLDREQLKALPDLVRSQIVKMHDDNKALV